MAGLDKQGKDSDNESVVKKSKIERKTKLAGERTGENAKKELKEPEEEQEETEEVSGTSQEAGPEAEMVGEEVPEVIAAEVPTTGMTIDLKSGKKGFLDSLGEQKLLIIVLAVAFVLILAGSGYYFYQKRSVSEPNQRPEVIETEAVQPVVTPQAETEEISPASLPLDRKDLKIKIVNGSGVSGAAGKAKKLLEDLGYKDIQAGNADSYDYQQTEIAIKEDKKDYLELLTTDLAEDYTLAEETITLDKDSDFDAIITIGG